MDHVVAGIAYGLLVEEDHDVFAHGQRLERRAGEADSGGGADVEMLGKEAYELVSFQGRFHELAVLLASSEAYERIVGQRFLLVGVYEQRGV